MARQYLGVLYSHFGDRGASLLGRRLLGFAFADRRKSQSAETLANLACAKLNLPSKLQ